MRILLAVDGSLSALAAAQFLNGITLTGGDEVTVLMVEHGPARGDAALAAAGEATAGSPAAIRQTTRRGRPAAEILRAAEEGAADLVVVGSRGLSPDAAGAAGQCRRRSGPARDLPGAGGPAGPRAPARGDRRDRRLGARGAGGPLAAFLPAARGVRGPPGLRGAPAA